MSRHHALAVLLTLWPALIPLGCDRTREGRKAGPAAEAPSEPALKAGDDARTILAKAVKAHGGEKALSCWNCGYLKYTTRGGVVPAPLGEVTVEDTFQLPGHFKRVTRMDAGGTRRRTVYVINHGKGWIKKDNAPVQPIGNNITERTEHEFAGFCNPAPLMEAGVRLTRLGAEKVSGKEAVGIRARSDRLGEVDFYFGAQTGLLVKSRKELPAAGTDRPSVMEAFLDDYQSVQGIQVPMRITGTQDGRTNLDVTLIEARFADRFDESTFARP
jgi:hypothetical protein